MNNASTNATIFIYRVNPLHQAKRLGSLICVSLLPILGIGVQTFMEFSSYIEDICTIPREIKHAKYWGFHIRGIAPADLDNSTLLGEIMP